MGGMSLLFKGASSRARSCHPISKRDSFSLLSCLSSRRKKARRRINLIPTNQGRKEGLAKLATRKEKRNRSLKGFFLLEKKFPHVLWGIYNNWMKVKLWRHDPLRFPDIGCTTVWWTLNCGAMIITISGHRLHNSLLEGIGKSNTIQTCLSEEREIDWAGFCWIGFLV